jgi:hypothetical protein
MPFLTIAGENKIALNQSVNGGLTIANFVLANVPNLDAEPADRITVMPDSSLIVDTLPFTKRGYVNPNQVVYSLVMGSNLGDYDFNWIGLVDEDGVLVVVSHVPNIQKRKSVGGVPGNTITRNFLIEYTDIQNITATTVPVETWQIDFSDRLNGIDERERLTNLDIYGHEGFLDDGWKVTGSAGTYSVAAGIGYVGGIRAKNVATHEVITSTFPNEIWLNVSLQGDISDMTAVAEFVIDAGPFADYVDGNGIAHYLTKIADIDAPGEVNDGRITYETLTQHEDKDNPHTQYQTKALATEQASNQKNYSDSLQTKKRLFTVSGDGDSIVLTSKSGATPIAALNDYDEFSFIVSETNTAQTVTIKIDDLDPVAVASITDDTQLLVTALATVTYIDGSLYLTNQINPKNGNPVSLIGRLITSPFSFTGAGKMHYDGGELRRDLHPILFALAQKDGLIDQATKDADLKVWGARFGDGDGATTFTILTFDGAFIRFNGSSLAGRELGSWETDAIRNITGSITSTTGFSGGVFSGTSGAFANSSKNQVVPEGNTSYRSNATGVTLDVSRVVPTAADNHPENYLQNAEFYC